MNLGTAMGDMNHTISLLHQGDRGATAKVPEERSRHVRSSSEPNTLKVDIIENLAILASKRQNPR